MPNFKNGDKFLFLLKNYINNTYAPTTCVASYFYLDDENMTVYPGGLDWQTAHFSGMKLEAVKQEFHQILTQKG